MAGEQLRVTEGKERGRRLSVDADLLIGRIALEDDGRLGDDPEISRRHARVSRGAEGQLTIEDLGSANGTFVNDERIDAPRRRGALRAGPPAWPPRRVRSWWSPTARAGAAGSS
jgi:pSer/pThr/pTyr-binding forkhead associated (FHA) protein